MGGGHSSKTCSRYQRLLLLEGAKACRDSGKGFEMCEAYYLLEPTANTGHSMNPLVLTEIYQHHVKQGRLSFCLVNERLGEMLLSGGSGGIILEAKGSY